MQISKSLIVGILAIVLVVLLSVVIIMRDNTQLVSAQEAQNFFMNAEA